MALLFNKMAGMIVGQFVHADLDLSGAATFLDLHTKAGAEFAVKRFNRPVDNANGIRILQQPVIDIRKQFRKQATLESDIVGLLKKISTCELAVSEIINFDSVDKRILETTEQVYWAPTHLGRFINSWGPVIEFILFWKTLISPAFAVLTPFLVIILPYILLRTMFNLNIPVAEYVVILQRLLMTNTPNLPFGEEGSPLTQLAKYAYILMSAGVFISNIWNQVQSAIHLRAVAADIRTRGTHIMEYVNSCKAVASLLNDKEGIACAESIGLNPETYAVGAYGSMYNESRALARLRDWVSELDLTIGIARLKGICFPKALPNKGQFEISISGLYHPGVPSGRRVLNDVEFGKTNSPHMLITGPNRGGKSTLCKSIGFAVMCAQSWGFVWAKSMNFVPVARFETALAPADTLGRLSLFEAEIEFAKHLLAVADKAAVDKQESPLLIIMDEIFHSTNAHDGAEASMIFLKQLYEKSQGAVGSLISTHYRELPDKLKEFTRNYCMEAFDNQTDGIKYTYRCIPGISTISSVKEILRERGLLKM